MADLSVPLTAAMLVAASVVDWVEMLVGSMVALKAERSVENLVEKRVFLSADS